VTPQDLPAVQDGLSTPGALAPAPPECEVLLTHLWDYLDGNCAGDVAGRIIAHVPACSPCTRHLLIQEQFFSSLAEVRDRSAAPRGLHESVRNRLAGERGTYADG
jgi:anti-sigma factor (TIGR02949 family)